MISICLTKSNNEIELGNVLTQLKNLGCNVDQYPNLVFITHNDKNITGILTRSYGVLKLCIFNKHNCVLKIDTELLNSVYCLQ